MCDMPKCSMQWCVPAKGSTATKTTPMQLVFGCNSILNVQHLADWRYIQSCKQDLININNKQENSKCREHTYATNNQVLVKQAQTSKYGTTQYKGPYIIIKVNDNGTVCLHIDNIIDTYNIRQIKPYH